MANGPRGRPVRSKVKHCPLGPNDEVVETHSPAVRLRATTLPLWLPSTVDVVAPTPLQHHPVIACTAAMATSRRIVKCARLLRSSSTVARGSTHQQVLCARSTCLEAVAKRDHRSTMHVGLPDSKRLSLHSHVCLTFEHSTANSFGSFSKSRICKIYPLLSHSESRHSKATAGPAAWHTLVTISHL